MTDIESLAGKRVGALESRMAGQLSNLLSKRGAEVLSAPALREAPVDCAEQVAELIAGFADGDFQLLIAQTGVGVNALFAEAEKLGRREELLTALRRAVCVARGPKPVAAFRKAGVLTPVKVESPYTTEDLIHTLSEFDLSGCGVAVAHYGERNLALADALTSACADLYEICLYEWMMPEDTAPLEELIAQTLTGKLDAIAFTSQVQVRHVFNIAEERNFGSVLASAMNSTAIAAVGPTCARALLEYGVMPDIVPETPKMGHMVAELAHHFSPIRTPRP